MHEGSLASSDCYSRSKDATIPTGGGSMPLEKLQHSGHNAGIGTGGHTRPNVVFFAGKASAGVRQKVVQAISSKNLSIYHSDHRFSYLDYLQAMQQSEFCMVLLCVARVASSVARLYPVHCRMQRGLDFLFPFFYYVFVV